jgi:C4-dicarboxylate transporter DctQ subunit
LPSIVGFLEAAWNLGALMEAPSLKTQETSRRPADGLIKKIARIIYAFEKMVIVILFTFMFTVTFAQVIARYFFNTGWAWVPEMVVFACISMTVAASSTGIKTGVHIGVDVIVKLFPVRFWGYSKFFADICGTSIFLFMSYLSLAFVLYLKDMKHHSIITGFPIWLMVSYLPIGFVFMSMHHIESLMEGFRERKVTEFQKKHI